MNPEIPIQAQYWFIFCTAAVVALVAVALINLVLARRTLGTQSTVIWLFAIILLPILGSILWLTVGRASDKQGVKSGSATRLGDI